MNNLDDAALVAALRSYKQADEEGVFVTVSREACEVAADRIAALSAQQGQVYKLPRQVGDPAFDGAEEAQRAADFDAGYIAGRRSMQEEAEKKIKQALLNGENDYATLSKAIRAIKP